MWTNECITMKSVFLVVASTSDISRKLIIIMIKKCCLMDQSIQKKCVFRFENNITAPVVPSSLEYLPDTPNEIRWLLQMFVWEFFLGWLVWELLRDVSKLLKRCRRQGNKYSHLVLQIMYSLLEVQGFCFTRNVGEVVPEIIQFRFWKMKCIGSKHPRDMSFNFENNITRPGGTTFVDTYLAQITPVWFPFYLSSF